MRFGVLGRVQAWTAEGELVPVPETKVRALLADLLAHRGHPISPERLIDDLWGGDLPANPTSALQVKVSRLRHALEQAEPGGGELVAGQPPGYMLKVEPGMTDADRFAELSAQGQRIEEPRARSAALAEALALWRGPAFADFADESFVRPAAHRLEEQRLSTLEAQAEARLELGEVGMLTGELADLVERYPLRERLRSVQMRALYRAGRQSEALDSYARLRERLADELGLDPGPELAALYQAILEQDPALRPQVSAAPRAPSRTNLPAALTGLIGRQEAVDELRSLLDAGRLVTLTGPGGVGKTRLAIETAGQMMADLPDGGWLVELAGLRPRSSSPAVNTVSRAVAAAICIRDDTTAGGAPLSSSELLADALRSKRLLLVLDNCEHIIEPVAKLVELLLRAAPELRVLATSREPLALAGEVVWPVPPLPLPDPAAGLADLARSDSVRLFVQRATAVAPRFTLDAGNARQVAELCRRLDGVPLALELAATRVPALGVHELVKRLDDRFRLLAARRRDAPERQQTLRALIDWSWDLLTECDQAVLRRLAVHADGCTLAAAEHVCSGPDINAENVVDVLARLVDRSLLTMTEGPDGPRYRMLETVADYCVQRLREAGETVEVRRRFHHHQLALAKEAEPHLRRREQREWLDRLDRERTNLHHALDGMVDLGDAAGALELAASLAWSLFLLGRLGQARSALQRALSADGAEPAGRRATARAWHAAMTFLTEGGTDQDAHACVAGQAFEDIEHPRERARAQWFLGYAMYIGVINRTISEDLVNRALATFRETGDLWGTAAALGTKAHHAMAGGDLRALEEYGEQSARMFRDLGDRWGQVQTVRPLAYLAEATGDYDRAAQLLREGMRMAEELRFWSEAADHTMGLGRIAMLRRDYAQARELTERAQRLAVECHYRGGQAHCEIGLALIERREGDLDSAEARMSSLLEQYRHVPFPQGAALFLAELGFIAEQRGDAETALARHLEGLGFARATGDPRTVALELEGLAGAQTLRGHHDHAARMLGAADAARQAAGAPLPAAERGDVDRIAARARSAMGEDAFAAEFRRGTELAPEECLSAMPGMRVL